MLRRTTLAAVTLVVLLGFAMSARAEGKGKSDGEFIVQEVDGKGKEHKAIEAQNTCPITGDDLLGEEEGPIKITRKSDNKSIYVCCDSCIKKAEKDFDKILAKLAKKKSEKSGG